MQLRPIHIIGTLREAGHVCKAGNAQVQLALALLLVADALAGNKYYEQQRETVRRVADALTMTGKATPLHGTQLLQAADDIDRIAEGTA